MSKKLNKFRRGVLQYAPTLLFLTLAACNNPNRTTLEYMPDMADSPAVKPQEAIMRVPPKGSVPQGYAPYPYTQDQGDLAGTQLKNPLSLTKANLQKGKKTYDTFCIVCHGPTGKGNGLIVPKFPMPPKLDSDKVREWPDGRLFHVMTLGQNLMPSYASQVAVKDRWAATLYVRALQRSIHPTPEDIETWEKIVKEGK